MEATCTSNTIRSYFFQYTAFTQHSIFIDNHLYALTGIDENFFLLYPEVFVRGRAIWEDDVISKKRVVVIDEDTSLALFRTSECIGRSLTIHGLDYRIIGVYKQTTAIGKPLHRLIVPVSVIGEAKTITVSVIGKSDYPLPFSVFEGIMSRIFDQPICFSIEKEINEALYPLMFFIACALAYGGGRMLKKFHFKAAGIKERENHRLREMYFAETIPSFMVDILIACALLISGILLIYAALTLVSRPIFSSPEWMPKSILDIGELYSKIATNNGHGWEPVTYFTQTVLKIRFWSRILNISLFLLLIYCVASLANIILTKRLTGNCRIFSYSPEETAV